MLLTRGRLALLDKVGTCTLHYDSGNWGHSVVSRLSLKHETVECCTLERFLETHEIEGCDFVKFNCEGAEFPILMSSNRDVLRRIRKMLVLYHCDLWRSSETLTPADAQNVILANGCEAVTLTTAGEIADKSGEKSPCVCKLWRRIS